MLKALIGAALIASSVSSPALAVAACPQPVAVDENAVVLIRCGSRIGTAFYISPRRVVTAQHVSVGGDCSIGSMRLTKAREDANHDITLLYAPVASKNVLAILCEPMEPGKHYTAHGFPGGRSKHLSLLTAKRDIADRSYGDGAEGMRVLDGQVFPGMSGGPQTANDSRAVQAITNRGTLPFLPVPPRALSRQLADTFICEGDL